MTQYSILASTDEYTVVSEYKPQQVLREEIDKIIKEIEVGK